MAKIDERKRSTASQRTPEQVKTMILKAAAKHRPTPLRYNHGKSVFMCCH